MRSEWPYPTRRAVLGGAAASLLLGRRALALGQGSQFEIAELTLSRGTASRPDAWKRLLFEVIQSTSVECDPTPHQLAPEDPALFQHPFCVLVGDGELPDLSEEAVQQLTRYLSYGGFLLVDDATATPDGPFERSFQQLCTRIFPTRTLSPLPGDHSIYRSFFLIDRPYGRTDVRMVLEGVTTGPTTPLVWCGNDLSGALDRSPDGRDRMQCVPGGEWQRREALKLGINLVLYALTSNYKHDLAHEIELRNEGRLE